MATVSTTTPGLFGTKPFRPSALNGGIATPIHHEPEVDLVTRQVQRTDGGRTPGGSISARISASSMPTQKEVIAPAFSRMTFDARMNLREVLVSENQVHSVFAQF